MVWYQPKNEWVRARSSSAVGRGLDIRVDRTGDAELAYRQWWTLTA
jgi:hypothetical protein